MSKNYAAFFKLYHRIFCDAQCREVDDVGRFIFTLQRRGNTIARFSRYTLDARSRVMRHVTNDSTGELESVENFAIVMTDETLQRLIDSIVAVEKNDRVEFTKVAMVLSPEALTRILAAFDSL